MYDGTTQLSMNILVRYCTVLLMQQRVHSTWLKARNYERHNTIVTTSTERIYTVLYPNPQRISMPNPPPTSSITQSNPPLKKKSRLDPSANPISSTTFHLFPHGPQTYPLSTAFLQKYGPIFIVKCLFYARTILATLWLDHCARHWLLCTNRRPLI